MQKRSIEIIVGIFMISALFIFSWFAFKISGINNIYDKNSYYDVYVEFSNIGNLKKNSKVSIAGVCVGRVKNIYLDKNYFCRKKDDYWFHTENFVFTFSGWEKVVRFLIFQI